MTEIERHNKIFDRSQFEVSDDSKSADKNEAAKNSRIYLAAITANISAIAVGTCMSWSSPIMPKLRGEDISDSPLSRPVSANEEAWITSIIAIGASITPFIAGPLADKIGRKKVLLSSAIFFILGYIFMLSAKDVLFLLIGRTFKGFGIGFVMCVSPMYVGEISNDQTRGATGALMSFLLACGLYYVYCIGPFVSYAVLQYCCLLVPLIFIIAFTFMPESPFYYAAKGERAAASKSLQFLRGQNAKAVEAELIAIENMVEASMAQQGNFLEIFKTSSNRRALIMSLGLIFFQQVSGINAVLFNAQTIFDCAHMSFSSSIASIIVGTVQTITATISPFVSNKFGRKTILLASAIFMCIGLTTLGVFFYVQINFKDIDSFSWLPVPALVVYIIAFTLGFGPIPWTVLGEIFSPNVKSLASAMTASSCWSIGFFVALYYPALQALGTFYAFWLFALFCVLAFVFVALIIFETKDLSLNEIQNKLNYKSF